MEFCRYLFCYMYVIAKICYLVYFTSSKNIPHQKKLRHSPPPPPALIGLRKKN
jgi:hypothetical protein